MRTPVRRLGSYEDVGIVPHRGTCLRVPRIRSVLCWGLQRDPHVGPPHEVFVSVLAQHKYLLCIDFRAQGAVLPCLRLGFVAPSGVDDSPCR